MGEVDGVTTLDGPSVDDVGGAESELGWSDVGGVVLLPGVDVGDTLGVDGPSLLGGAEGWTLGMGLIDSPGLSETAYSDGRVSDVGDSDVGEADVGLALDGGAMLPDTSDVELRDVSLDTGEIPLLGAADEGVDWLGTLDTVGLVSDDTPGLVELADGGDVDC